MEARYIPYQFQPDTTYLTKAEFDTMMNDLRGRSIDFLDYLKFVRSMADDNPLYDSMFTHLAEGNIRHFRFKHAEKEILALVDNPLTNIGNVTKILEFYKKYKEDFPLWATRNEPFIISIIDQYRSNFN